MTVRRIISQVFIILIMLVEVFFIAELFAFASNYMLSFWAFIAPFITLALVIALIFSNALDESYKTWLSFLLFMTIVDLGLSFLYGGLIEHLIMFVIELIVFGIITPNNSKGSIENIANFNDHI